MAACWCKTRDCRALTQPPLSYSYPFFHQPTGDERITQRSVLTPDQKNRRVVLKRVNLDPEGVRSGFLRAGTMAKGAAETGAVESYMCAKVRLYQSAVGCQQVRNAAQLSAFAHTVAHTTHTQQTKYTGEAQPPGVRQLRRVPGSL